MSAAPPGTGAPRRGAEAALTGSPTAREELLRIQRRLADSMQAEIQGAIQRESPEIGRYIRDFRRETRTFRTLSSRDELLGEILASDLVYVGDYHTLRESQNTVFRVLDEAFRRGKVWRRKEAIVLALEMMLAEHQPLLDRFLAGDLDEPTFLRAVGYEENWGFNWSHYKPLLDFARERGIDVVGINSSPPKGPRRLRARDETAARILAYLQERIPDALVVVLIGDLHVAARHLPDAVDAELARRGLSRRRLIVHQNVESIYWQLARQGLEHEVDVVRLAGDSFCVLNATPLASFRSYLDWQEKRGELRCELHPWWCDVGGPEVDLTDLVLDLARTISSFLRLPLAAADLERLSVGTTHERDFLDRLSRRVLTAEERREVEILTRRNEGVFVPRADTILLPDLSVNHAAEQAAQFVHIRASGAGLDLERRPADEFYRAVLRRALGYFGSKLLNHKRTCRKEADFRQIVEEGRGKRLTTEWKRELRRIAAYVCEHRERERRFLAEGAWPVLHNLHRLAPGVRLGLAQALGYLLGDRLHDALVLGAVQKEELRELFLRRFERPGEPLAEYLYLVRRLRHVREFYKSRRERM